MASRARPRRDLDVFLFPSIVGGGLGDITGVFDAAAALRTAGFPAFLFRRPGRALPPSVEGPWLGRSVRRVTSIPRSAPRALTISANWGVSAAPERPGPLGRAGPWSPEAADVEAAYGTERTLHVSLEEFARTLTSREENSERWREGGRRHRAIARDRPRPAYARDARRIHDAFRTFRGFDRPNVLHLFQAFAPSSAFAAEFPEAVQIGPIWPPSRPRPRRDPGRWVWYASPASADRILEGVAAGLRGTGVRSILVRAPRALPMPKDSTVRWSLARPMTARAWYRAFDSADVRIVTGSRTLLEAISLGRPFLYFNGTLGEAARQRRHRPEKVRALLTAWRREGVRSGLRRDLADFARGRRVEEIVRSAATDAGWGRPWPRRPGRGSFSVEHADGGRYLVQLAQEFAGGQAPSHELVARRRAER